EKEKETKWFEAVLAETRAELNHMEGAEQKAKTRLRKLERKNSEIKKGNRLAAMNIARIQLCIDAVLDLLNELHCWGLRNSRPLDPSFCVF
ncbi:hypothetical protein QQP08_020560, partial [Theobroma cacao]